MCRPASFIIVKGPKALWSKTDDAQWKWSNYEIPRTQRISRAGTMDGG